MRTLPVFVALFLSSQAYAQHDHHKGLGAHEHGAIKLEVAVEAKEIELEIDGPAESFIGFEYAPKTAKEKKAFTDAQELWKKNLLTKLFILDSKLGCSVSEASFEQEMESHDEKPANKKEAGVHSDIEAKAKIVCAKDPKGSEVSVALKKHFSHIKKLQVDLVGSETKTININKAVESFKL